MVTWVTDKEKDIYQETERIRRQVKAEKQVQIELQKEIDSLKLQLEKSRQGLQAASRLGDQLEYSKLQISGLKEEGKMFHNLLHIVTCRPIACSVMS